MLHQYELGDFVLTALSLRRRCSVSASIRCRIGKTERQISYVVPSILIRVSITSLLLKKFQFSFQILFNNDLSSSHLVYLAFNLYLKRQLIRGGAIYHRVHTRARTESSVGTCIQGQSIRIRSCWHGQTPSSSTFTEALSCVEPMMQSCTSQCHPSLCVIIETPFFVGFQSDPRK